MVWAYNMRLISLYVDKQDRNLGWLPIIIKGLHHYYTLHRLSVQIEVPSRGSISKKKLVCLYKFGTIFSDECFLQHI